jgi:soluble lytic murein transglycosylase-like protein
MKKIIYLISIIIVLLISTIAFSETTIDLDIISKIESNGNSKAVSYKGAKYGRGKYQISEIVLEEWNNYHLNDQYNTEQLFNEEINERIANWYLHIRIPIMIAYYGKDVTIKNVLIAYNAGISYVAYDKSIPNETKNYIEKYNKLLEE